MTLSRLNPIHAVLGIDAAWTANQPSGVALAEWSTQGWRCIAVAPNYDSFIALADGVPVDWDAASIPGSLPPVALLLKATNRLTAGHLSVVAIDMPIATDQIKGRRDADNEISKTFGGRGCSTHSPNAERPGKLGETLSRDFQSQGYTIATYSDPTGTLDRLIEVYPHPALLSLLGREKRVCYKVSKTNKYWPESSASERRQLILGEFHAICNELHKKLGPFELPLPPLGTETTFRMLKRYEDALDALVCLWVGTKYIERTAEPFGNSTAAIWCPSDPLPSTH